SEQPLRYQLVFFPPSLGPQRELEFNDLILCQTNILYWKKSTRTHWLIPRSIPPYMWREKHEEVQRLKKFPQSSHSLPLLRWVNVLASVMGE
ncbi:Hypothetical predicted protein, partial [Pelobates cultripes]